MMVRVYRAADDPNGPANLLAAYRQERPNPSAPTVLAAVGLVLEELITPVARAFYGWYLVQNPPTDTQRGYYPSGGYR